MASGSVSQRANILSFTSRGTLWTERFKADVICWKAHTQSMPVSRQPVDSHLPYNAHEQEISTPQDEHQGYLRTMAYVRRYLDDIQRPSACTRSLALVEGHFRKCRVRVVDNDQRAARVAEGGFKRRPAMLVRNSEQMSVE